MSTRGSRGRSRGRGTRGCDLNSSMNDEPDLMAVSHEFDPPDGGVKPCAAYAILQLKELLMAQIFPVDSSRMIPKVILNATIGRQEVGEVVTAPMRLHHIPPEQVRHLDQVHATHPAPESRTSMSRRVVRLSTEDG